MNTKFPKVKHVILDEVQSFQSEEGDWLKKARCLVRQSCSDTEPDSGFSPTPDSESQRESASELESQSPMESEPVRQEQGTQLPSVSEFRSLIPSLISYLLSLISYLLSLISSLIPVSYPESTNIPGYLWMFIDNEQVNHTFKSGVPKVHEQVPSFRLKKVIRNSRSIFSHAKNYLDKNAARELEIGHDFTGLKVHCLKYSRDKQLEELKRVLQSLFREGYSEGELVILFDKEESIPDVSVLKSKLDLQKIVGAVDDHLLEVVVTSFRKYSGLDRPVAILVNMKASLQNSVGYKIRASMYCAATRGMVRLIELEEETGKDTKKHC